MNLNEIRELHAAARDALNRRIEEIHGLRDDPMGETPPEEREAFEDAGLTYAAAQEQVVLELDAIGEIHRVLDVCVTFQALDGDNGAADRAIRFELGLAFPLLADSESGTGFLYVARQNEADAVAFLKTIAEDVTPRDATSRVFDLSTPAVLED